MYVRTYVYTYIRIYAYQHKGNLTVDKVCMYVLYVRTYAYIYVYVCTRINLTVVFFICKQACSVYAMQGRREYMEDDFSIHFPPPPRDPTGEGGGGEGECDSVGERGEEPALFGVFDGHGGARVSQYASKHLLGMYPPPHMHYACILLLI